MFCFNDGMEDGGWWWTDRCFVELSKFTTSDSRSLININTPIIITESPKRDIRMRSLAK